MILGLEIGMLIAGISAIFRGKLPVSKDRAIEGPAAVLAGIFLILPLPVALAVGFFLGAGLAVRGQSFDGNQMRGSIIVLELVILGGCGAVAGLICLVSPKVPTGKRSFLDDNREAAARARFNLQLGDRSGTMTAQTYQGMQSRMGTGAPPLPGNEFHPEGEKPEPVGKPKSGKMSTVLMVSGVVLAIGLGVLVPILVNNSQEKNQPAQETAGAGEEAAQKPNEYKAGPDKSNPLPAGAVAAITPGEAGEVLVVAYSQDGQTLVVGTRSGRALWFDANTHQLLAAAPPQKIASGVDNLNGATVSPEGDQVAFVKHGGLLFLRERLNLAEQLVLQKPLPGTVQQWRVAFAPDGNSLCTSHGDRKARLWDVNGKGLLRVLAGHKNQVGSTAYSPNGAWLASADTEVFLWRLPEKTPFRKLKGPGRYFFSALTFSPDGKQLAGVHDRTVVLWNLEGPANAATPQGSEIPHQSHVYALAFSPDSRQLLAATHGGKIHLWDTRTLQRRHEWQLDSSVTTLGFRADGRFAAGQANRVILFDLGALRSGS